MIPLFKVFMAKEAAPQVIDVLSSGYVGEGDKVKEFEALLQNHFNNRHVKTVNSCTSGLHLSLDLMKCLAPNEEIEVLTTPLSCTATNLPIIKNGMKIKWVDIDPKTCNIDLEDLAHKLTPKTRIIMAVHWGGYPCDLDRLREITDSYKRIFKLGIALIEDCAHAWGAKYKNTLVGNSGNICVFSFQAIKHFTTVDGGCIVSPHGTLDDRVRLTRWYGLDRERSSQFRCSQNIGEPGFKFHMNNVNAAIGIANYPHAEWIVNKHKENGKFYNEELKGIQGLELLENKEDRESSYWVYTVLVENRKDFMTKMEEKGIMVSQVHDRNDKHRCFKEFKSYLPNLDKICEKICCIPCGWWVNEEDRQYIADCIKEGW